MTSPFDFPGLGGMGLSTPQWLLELFDNIGEIGGSVDMAQPPINDLHSKRRPMYAAETPLVGTKEYYDRVPQSDEILPRTVMPSGKELVERIPPTEPTMASIFSPMSPLNTARPSVLPPTVPPVAPAGGTLAAMPGLGVGTMPPIASGVTGPLQGPAFGAAKPGIGAMMSMMGPMLAGMGGGQQSVPQAPAPPAPRAIDTSGLLELLKMLGMSPPPGPETSPFTSLLGG